MDGRAALLWLSIIFGVLSICKGQNRGNLKLNDNLKLGWRINSTKGTIRFTVKARIDENGWFLIGFVPQMNNSKKVSLEDISGDGFVVWKGASKIQGKRPIWRITEINVEKRTLHTEAQTDIHLGSSSYDKNTHTLTVIVWRPLKTKNDIEIKQGQEFVVFGSYGNEDSSKIKKWKNKLKQLNKNGAVEDAFTTVEHVDLFKMTSKHEKKKSNDEKGIAYAEIAEKHWIGVVIGISAFLTVIITCSVYCFTKKKKNQFKRVVSMPFHKNGDDEDEAKVAFLQSEET